MSCYNTRCLRFVSSLVVLTIKRDAQAFVFAECLKGSQIKVNRANFFPTDRRTKWLAAICTVSCPIFGHFLQNCNILPQNSTNKLKFSHDVTSTAGIKVGREVSSAEALWFLCNYGKSRSSSVT